MTPLPSNQEAERALLGAVLINPDVLQDAMHLPVEAFSDRRNAKIWEALLDLRRNGIGIDNVTLVGRLQSANELAEAGGGAYITGILADAPPSINCRSYIQAIYDAYIRRRVVLAATRIAREVYGGAQVDALADMALREVREAVAPLLEHRADGLRDVVSRVDDSVRAAADGKGVIDHVPSLFVPINTILGGGYARGALVIIAGRPGSGKSAFLLQEMRQDAVLFSMEMSAEQVVRRMIAQRTGIHMTRLRLGQLGEDEWVRYNEAIASLADSNMEIIDTPNMTIDKMDAMLEMVTSRRRISMVLVDYTALVMLPGEWREHLRVDAICRRLKLMARKYDVPIVAAHQLNRAIEGENRPPRLSDLNEGGEKDADTIIILHAQREDMAPVSHKKRCEIHIVKGREHETGKIEAIFDAPIVRFIPLPFGS